MPRLSAQRGAGPCALPQPVCAAGHVPELPVCSPAVRTAEPPERQAGLPAQASSERNKIAALVPGDCCAPCVFWSTQCSLSVLVLPKWALRTQKVFSSVILWLKQSSI